ncbi:hypothetical protein ACQPZF_27265 [Actinosynnema sp. CS-041913]|uniref:hypothetical protein n=1 Tax=Actinosynnema sp. CS-041913 TaxID=3239917 RepID=UPI003D931F59
MIVSWAMRVSESAALRVARARSGTPIPYRRSTVRLSRFFDAFETWIAGLGMGWLDVSSDSGFEFAVRAFERFRTEVARLTDDEIHELTKDEASRFISDSTWYMRP